MTIYQDSKRIVGTNLERVGGTTNTIPSGGVGGWKEVGRTKLGSGGDTITVSSLPDKRYYMILGFGLDTGGTIGMNQRLNGDTSNNYSSRQSQNGGSDTEQTTTAQGRWADTNASDHFGVCWLANKSDREKLMYGIANQQKGTAASQAPASFETASKWANASNAVSSFTMQNFGTGNYDTNSEVVVLAYDPDDTHTDNFWEELASVTTTTSGTISSGTITAKKYLMYQIIGKKASGSGTGSPRFQFNGDTGSNYSQRNSINGTHYEYGSQSSANIGGDGNTAGEMAMFTGFIINNLGTQKLFMGYSAFGNSAGASQIGNKGEIFDKWTGTAQITSILCMNLNFEAGAKMTIWGSD